MADTIIVYRYGGIEQIGPPKEIFSKPINENVAKLVGMNNIFKGKILDITNDEVMIQSHKKIIAPGMEGLHTGEEVTWCIRPDQVMVVRENRPSGKAVVSNVFSGKITEIISNGATYLLYIDGDFYLEIEIPSHAFERLDIKQGQITFFNVLFFRVSSGILKVIVAILYHHYRCEFTYLLFLSSISTKNC
jgi:ABC-type Fe3+/spermidine/putrescine transport system ATPase subunit